MEYCIIFSRVWVTDRGWSWWKSTDGAVILKDYVNYIMIILELQIKQKSRNKC